MMLPANRRLVLALSLLAAVLLLGCSSLGLLATYTPTSSSPTTQVPFTSVPPTPTVETPTRAPSPAPTATALPAGLPDPGTASWQKIASGLADPTDLQDPGDGRLFVVQQPGVIRIIQNGQLLPQPFLDIRRRVDSQGSERGLLGLAFDPSYAANGRFYVDYTGAGGTTHVSRFLVSSDPNQADPTSEQVLLEIPQPYANHNGGQVVFGPDGYLYIGAGDGGSAGDPLGNGQNLNTLLGKILRIDVSPDHGYAIPPDNPFVGKANARPEIWAYGLRNPWRFAFDPATGDLYIADVGQSRWEEVDFQSAGSKGGQNYGWSIREGFHEYKGTASGLTDPVVEYSHQYGCAITGGKVVRTPDLPGWAGVYLYGDYCSGRVWGLRRQPDGTWMSQQLFGTGLSITTFGQDSAGRVYLLDHSGGVYQLVPAQ